MDEEVAKGNRPTITFTKTCWNYMRSQINASTGYNYSHDQLKNKFNKLRQIYKDFKKILSDMIGNHWDPLLGTINVEEEQWNELFKVNKRAKKFRKSGCPHYEKLIRIFGDTTATIECKEKNDILVKRSFGCTSSQVDESQTSSKKDDLHEELMECLDILNTMEDVDGEAYSKILKLLHRDLLGESYF
uniref:Myb/SANT-like domain-containing protein n=1 Tax=Cucumis melo TaxID=3656 RepID=A0A9I9EEZ4_CUCME